MGTKKRKTVKDVRLELVELGENELPKLEVARIDAEGNRETLPLDEGCVFPLDLRYVGENNRLEIRSSEQGEARVFAYDQVVEQLTVDDRFRLAPGLWRCWLGFTVCVGGRVEVCRPYFPYRPFGDVIADFELGARNALRDLVFERFEPIEPILTFPERCDPVCHGKVEVFVRTCCCTPIIIDPPIIIQDLCEIIDCRFPIDPIGPRFDELPRERIEGLVLEGTERALAKARERQDGTEEQIVEAAKHLSSLLLLPTRDEQRAYIEGHPILIDRICRCTTRKVGETHLGPGGDFNFCFTQCPILGPLCTQKVAYRVTQAQEGGWVVIYDGVASGEFFGFGEDARLRASWNADACDDPTWPDPDGIKPFVALEQIGTTWSDVLIHSTDQDGETSFAGPLAATDGLAWEAPAIPPGLSSGPYEQPWATTLDLRFQFHPGLEALGVRYFRIRVVKVDGNGNAVSTRIHTAGKSWRKYYIDGGDLKVRWVPLQADPSTVGGQQGLYRIPYFDPALPWLGGQWHASIDTREKNAVGSAKMPNGRYLFVVDVFDAAGNRLEPQNAGGATNFEYRRLDGPLDTALANTSVVPHKALANLFRVDNTEARADIEALKVNGLTPSTADCQFLEGGVADQLAIQYEARQTTGFQWRHWLSIKRGLNGPTRYTSNVAFGSFSAALSDSEMPGGSGSLTVGMTFGDLLNGEPKCAFAAYLETETKHTNGHGRRIQTYDRGDSAAFALLLPGACCPPRVLAKAGLDEELEERFRPSRRDLVQHDHD